MSASSESAPSIDSHHAGVDALCFKIHRRLSAPLDKPIAVSAHKHAVSCMLEVRDCVLRGAVLSSSAKMALLCSGITCMRRATFEIDTERQIVLLRTTQTLLFVLLAMTDEPLLDDSDCSSESQYGEGGGGRCAEARTEAEHSQKRRRTGVRDNQQLIATWQMKSLAEHLGTVGQQPASSWDTVLKDNTAISKVALNEARYIRDGDAMQQMRVISDVFFRCSAAAMTSSLIKGSLHSPGPSLENDTTSFLTLDTVGMLNQANELQSEKLLALADTAESEAGQTVCNAFYRRPTDRLSVWPYLARRCCAT